MTTPTPHLRWYHLTPDRFFVGLLVAQIFLLLSERFQWFAFNEKKGWTVLIAVGLVGLAVLLILLWGLVCVCLRRRFQRHRQKHQQYIYNTQKQTRTY